jgi:hypothetical protein
LSANGSSNIKRHFLESLDATPFPSKFKTATAILASEGESVLEGYPVKPTKPGNKNIPGVFAWTGTIPLFAKQGFTLAGSSSTAKLRYRKPLN